MAAKKALPKAAQEEAASTPDPNDERVRSVRWVVPSRDCFGPWKAPVCKDQDFKAGVPFKTTRFDDELPAYIAPAPAPQQTSGGVAMEAGVLTPDQAEHRVTSTLMVLQALDQANDEHWEENGAPNLAYVNQQLPPGITEWSMEEFRELFPGFVRPAPI